VVPLACARVFFLIRCLSLPLSRERGRAHSHSISRSLARALSRVRVVARSLAEWGLHGHVTQGRLTPIEDYEARIRAIEVTIYPDSEIAQRTLTRASAILGA